MNYLEDEKYLLDLLTRNKLLNKEQVKTFVLKKEQQRHLLIRKLGGRRANDRKRSSLNQPDAFDILVSLQFEIPGKKKQVLSEEDIIRAVAKDLNMPFKKLDPLELDLDLVTKTIPKSFALKHLLLPFDIKNGVYEVAIYEPAKRLALEDLERALQIKIKPYLSTKSDIGRMLAEFFGFQRSISAAETSIAGPMVDLGNLEQYVKISSAKEITSSDQHIKSAVDHLFTYAFEQRASDIHIEPKRITCMVRLRIDGVLHTIYNLPKVVHPAIVSRVKTLSRLDIAEKRRPQDGRIKVSHENKEAEIRVSTIPVAFGEKVVMRILDPDIIFQDLTNIGFSHESLKTYNNFVGSPHGIILVTGPTGSGKSTTLYSTLKSIATPEKNVVTVEDPVEMVHEDFNQIAVQSAIDVTFATILRNILRQDPDIIMIGEIRDLDTAAYAIQAALTGHLVFSTLHTNDAISAITRLVDLGVQPFMVSSTLLGAMAQRLVRKICPHCREKFTMSGKELRGFGFAAPKDEYNLQQGKGCRECRGTGYLGRCGIFEIFPMSDRLKKMVVANEASSELIKVAKQEGMKTLREDAWDKVLQGITTYKEVIRATGEEISDMQVSGT
ncbi:MAG: type II/IV secretion system protein [Deltaproteobacteria bacterium]|nr:MAG: type II/IV secretion system protein [Deltaproteobacteria bacterium]